VYFQDHAYNALNSCIERDLFSANDFRDALMFFRIDEPKITGKVLLPSKYSTVQVQIRNLDSYEPAGGEPV